MNHLPIVDCCPSKEHARISFTTQAITSTADGISHRHVCTYVSYIGTFGSILLPSGKFTYSQCSHTPLTWHIAIACSMLCRKVAITCHWNIQTAGMILNTTACTAWHVAKIRLGACWTASCCDRLTVSWQECCWLICVWHTAGVNQALLVMPHSIAT